MEIPAQEIEMKLHCPFCKKDWNTTFDCYCPGCEKRDKDQRERDKRSKEDRGRKEIRDA